MRKSLLQFAVLGLASTSLLSACADDLSTPEVVESDAGGTRIIRSETGALTPPSSAARDAIVSAYLSERGVHTGSLTNATEIPGRAGVTHVRFEQVIDGLRVHDAYVKAALDEHGQLLQVIERVATPTGTIAKPAINERAALAAALLDLGYGAAVPAKVGAHGAKSKFARGTVFHREPTVEQVVYVDDLGALRQGYLVETWSVRGNQLDHTLVASDGAIFSNELRTNNDSYHVFPEDPGKSGQSTVTGPTSSPGSATGWLTGSSHTTTRITGNNAFAYLDLDNNNAADTGGAPVSGGDFVAVADLGVTPASVANRAVAVQNLFYLNNVVHDRLYPLGFNEAAGNFQETNIGPGGLGSDSVNAEAQDGGGTDNANFATPTDGSNPRMQMYLWSGAAPSSLVTVGADSYGAYQSSFGAQVNATGVTGPLAVYTDNAGTDPSDGCELSTTPLTGKVVIVNRGTCDFTVKVLNAQKAGARAVLIANNVAGTPFAAGGTSRKVTIPSAMISQADGVTLAAAAGASSTLKDNPAEALMVDGDLDSDIVFHEYGHGLTWRMIGSMSGNISGAIGEGASDTLAFLINGDDRIGEYSMGDPAGIRRSPYGDATLTYSDWTGASVHADGEIYAAAMWNLRQRYLAAGLTAETLLGDFVDGMNHTNAAPAFENMRDGMLASIPDGDPRECLVWEAFAAKGIGVGAKANRNRRGAVSSITESFIVPAACNP